MRYWHFLNSTCDIRTPIQGSRTGSESHLGDDEEVVSGVSLPHDLLAVLKLHGLQGVGHGEPLPLVQVLCGEQGYKLMLTHQKAQLNKG